MSGNLYGCRTYLIGAMDRVEDFGAGWREWITPLLHELGVVVFNPVLRDYNKTAIVRFDRFNASNEFQQICRRYRPSLSACIQIMTDIFEKWHN